VAATFPQIFLDFHSSRKFIMHFPINRIFLEDHFGQKDKHLVCASLIREDAPSWTISPNLYICNILKGL